MTTHEASLSPFDNPVRIDPENQVIVAPTSRTEHEDVTRIIYNMNTLDPLAFEKMDEAIASLRFASEILSPYDVLNQIRSNSLVLERAKMNVQNDEDSTHKLEDIFYEDTILDISGSILTVLIKMAPVTEEGFVDDATATIRTAIQNPRNATRIARKLSAEHLDQSQSSDYENATTTLFTAYLATLLSGDQKAYGMLYKDCQDRALAIKDEKPISYDVVHDYMANRILSLHELAAGLDEDAESTFSEYIYEDALYTIMVALNETLKRRGAGLYRKKMLSAAYTLLTLVPTIDVALAMDEETDEEPSAAELLPMELDWEVLPPGDLTSSAREIVEGMARTTKTPSIDLGRLRILENLRSSWGEDRCYYSKGVRKRRSMVRENGKEQPDEYIILVLQEHDTQGNVISEHAVAESPIAGPNALYVQRYDVNHWSWRELMAMTKSDALDMGARRLKHEAPEGQDLVDYMTKKVEILLHCPEEEFLSLKFDGCKDNEPRIRLSRLALATALTS